VIFGPAFSGPAFPVWLSPR